MIPGDVVLCELPQADQRTKVRPALIISVFPPFDDALLCGISTQLHLAVSGLGEPINRLDEDFLHSGLQRDSLIRLNFLQTWPKRKILGKLGTISPSRLLRLRKCLSDFLLLKDNDRLHRQEIVTRSR